MTVVTLWLRLMFGKDSAREEWEMRIRHLLRTSPAVLLSMPRPQRLPRNHRLPSVYGQSETADETSVQAEGARNPRTAMVEALLMIADEPLPSRKLAKAAGLPDTTEVRQIVDQLNELYDADQTAFHVNEVAGGFQMLTRPVYHRWLARLQAEPELKLSPAARETLAIVAYRQPIVRADVEAIRGVQCGEILRQLMEKGLVRICGREQSLGRPVLYGTTRRFMQMYGLKNLKDLPEIEELSFNATD